VSSYLREAAGRALAGARPNHQDVLFARVGGTVEIKLRT